jgi:sulfur transfer protein SufE
MPSATPLPQRLRDRIDDVLLIPERQERLSWVVNQAKRAPGLPPILKSEANRVAGCISAVWIHGEVVDGILHLGSDADSPLVKGLVHFLAASFDGADAREVAQSEVDVLVETELWQDLSPTRQNGLRAVQARIKALASAVR